MSEQKLVSPLLDGLTMGNPMSDHDGIRCCPALKETTGEKYIVKIISVPASQVQLDALLLTGAYKDPAEAMDYFKEVADGIAAEVEALNDLAKLEGFLPFEGCQILPMENGKLGYEVYILSQYRRSLLRYMRKKPVTYLDAVNLGLDLCAALAICRRAGYLYVALKPGNVFLAKGKQFRIGDLGLVKLESLAHTSLPGQYRSPYVPAEVREDWKVLNETVDTYGVGMILYQIYNEGILPQPPAEPKDAFPYPANADYEMASIIMKTLDPDPANRWADPMQMGQALVGYLQRNTVNNVPITPPTGTPIRTDEPKKAPAAPAAVDAAPAAEDTESLQMPDEVPEDQPEAAPAYSQEEIPEDVPQEVPAPQPSAPVVREPAAAPIPEPEEEPAAEEEYEDDDDEDFSIAFTDLPTDDEEEDDLPPEPAPIAVKRKKRRSAKGLITALIVLLILALIGCGGFWFYEASYLQTIDDLVLSGTAHELTVTVTTKVDPSTLHVTCTDAYGNSTHKPLVDGQAVFTDLLPDSLYRIELTVDGFHQLTGKTAEIFSTEAMPTVVSLSAITGPEDGSMLVNFTVDGNDPKQWMLTCSAEGEHDVTEVFTGHTVTVRGLTVGKTYTVTLSSAGSDQVLGETTTEFAATRLILPENLTIADYADGVMTVRWDAPADSNVQTWNVRCYNDEGHEESLSISGTEIAFTDIDSTKSYTVEVSAEGMTHTSRISVSANPLTVTEFTANADEDGKLNVQWSFTGTAPEGGWLLMYTMDDRDDQNVVKCDGASAVISPAVPGSTYHFVIQAADSTSVFGASREYTTPDPAVYAGQGMSAEHVTAQLLKTPEEDNWTAETVGDSVYTDTFQVGDSISLVLKSGDRFNLPEMDINVLYVIRDSQGNVLSRYTATEAKEWKSLWYPGNYQNCELTIPKVPGEQGSYNLSLYFDNKSVAAVNFTIAG